MKRFVMVLAVCALLIPAASAFGDDFTWNGARSDAWTTHQNWTGTPQEYPDDTGDKAIINGLNWGFPGAPYVPNVNAAVTIGDLTMTGNGDGNAKLSFDSINNLTVTRTTELSDDVDLFGVGGGKLMAGDIEVKADDTVLTTIPDVDASSLRIDADTPNADRLFEKAGNGAMSLTGSVMLYGDGGSAGRATFQYTAGSFSASDFVMDGPACSGGEAVLDIDATLDMSLGSTDVTAEGYCEIDIASGTSFEVDTMEMVDSDTDWMVTGAGTTSTEMSCVTLTTNLARIQFNGPLTVVNN